MPDISEIRSVSFTHLGRGTRIIGEFFLEGEVQISSQIEGKLTAQSESTYITLGPASSVKGQIKGWDVEVFGHFSGQIESRGKVVIHASATVDGEIQCEHLVIYPGAVADIKGHTHA